ncbi:cupredoxin domain-containing protein [Paenibacillus sp. MBLB4367]|uniref:cupredoxin domain-containing protein n=1 Tax=Paenibacillus sp. MBLB4367 TaxID=3384767 RepID=UPI003907E912
MYKWSMFGLVIIAVVVGLGGLFGEVNKHAKENATEEDAGKSLKIVATNFKFDQAEYKVAKGEKLNVVFQSKEGIHEMEIEGLDVKLTKANSTKEVSFDKPGKYKVHCILPCGTGHADMVSTLIVE